MIDLKKKEYPAQKKVSILERFRLFVLRALDKLQESAEPPAITLKFEKWKCIPHQQELSNHFITVCNDDIKNGLKTLELYNGKLIDLVQKSDTEYRVTFKNKRVYKVIKYL